MIELSFIVPCFNSARSIEKTLNSIFSQKTHFPFEVIVVDNGSTDQTLKLISNFKARVLIEKRRGANHARNLGARNAQGKYVAFVDSDVVLEVNWAQELMDYIQSKNLLGAQGKIVRIPFNEQMSLLERYRCFNPTHPTNWMSLVTRDYRAGLINTAACIYQKEALSKVQFFSEVLRFHEDLDLTLKIRSLPSGAIGCTSAAVAKCYYTHGLLAYLKRAFIHGFFYARVRRRWNLNRVQPSFYKWESFSLSFLECFLGYLTFAGELLGQGMLKLYSPSEFEKENWRLKKLSSLPKEKPFVVYFEDRVLQNY